ncbi:MAG: M48 family metalloprotease [Phycisphaerae bacterium]|nr:M48 family metalloprotease [Phycisphaerae bacterium]
MEWILTQVNMMGRAFVGLAFPMLVTSAILIGIVLLAESVLRRRVRADLRYMLVACVLAYLVLMPLLSLNPPSTHWPTGGGSHVASLRFWGPQTAYAVPTSSTPAGHTHAPLSSPATGQTEDLPATDGEPRSSQTTLGGIGERPRTSESPIATLPASTGAGDRDDGGTLSWQSGIFLLWLIGVIVLGGVLLGRAMAAWRRLDRVPAANALMNDILLYCRSRMGVQAKVRLKVGPEGTRPAVCGLFHPVIIVPRNLAPKLGSRHLRDVLFHELAHVKRNDLWVNLAQNVLQVLYFYNPLILLVNAAIRRLREEAADERVLQTIGDPDHLYTRRLADVETITVKDPPPSLRLIGVA